MSPGSSIAGVSEAADKNAGMPTPIRASANLIRALSKYGACDVSDALVKLKYPHGGHIPDIDMISPRNKEATKIVGEAFTVKFVDAVAEKDAPKPAQHFVDAAEPDSVMVISVPSHCKNAAWGGLMTARAQSKGVKGVIIDGRCRDLVEHRDAEFPIFSRGHSTLGQSPFVRPSELQVPVTITPSGSTSSSTSFPSVTVKPYDIILADVDGVVAFDPQDLEKVLELCQKGEEVDGKCMRDIKAGRSVEESFKEHRGK